jgi:hypothetical protein
MFNFSKLLNVKKKETEKVEEVKEEKIENNVIDNIKYTEEDFQKKKLELNECLKKLKENNDLDSSEYNKKMDELFLIIKKIDDPWKLFTVKGKEGKRILCTGMQSKNVRSKLI